MRKYFIYFLWAALLGTAVSCKKETIKEDKSVNTEKTDNYQEFTINKELSNIDWKGYKILKSESISHFGTINLLDGKFDVKEGKLVSGKLVIDTKSITTTDIEDKEQVTKFDNYLKSSDFFDVEQFPTAVFEITKVTSLEQGDYNTLIEGNLTIKKTTKPVEFNANVKIDNEQISIYTEPTDIDRSEFGINFQLPAEYGILQKEFTLHAVIKAFSKK